MFVNSQVSTATKIGVTATPSFLINDQVVLGAQPFETFKKVIDGILAQANP